MANALYDYAREAFLKGEIDWMNDTIKCLLVDTEVYTPNLANHKFLSDINTSARVTGQTGVTLEGKATTGGAADANDVTFSNVSGSTIEAIVLYKESGGSAETSPLIAYMDVATGLPITPNGGDIIVSWDNGVNKIFKL